MRQGKSTINKRHAVHNQQLKQLEAAHCLEVSSSPSSCKHLSGSPDACNCKVVSTVSTSNKKQRAALPDLPYGLDFLWQIRNHFGVFLHRPFKRQKFWRKESRHSKSRTVRKSAFKFSMEVWWTHRCNTCRAAVHGAAMRQHKKGRDIKVCYKQEVSVE